MNSPIPHFTTLADKALLVKLSMSSYQPYAFDKGATEIIEQATGLKGTGRYNKRLFAGNPVLSNTNEKFRTLYNAYLKRTVPWLDDGVRMTPNALYFEFAKDMRGLIREAKLAADQLEQSWDVMVAADMMRLGPLANAADYPSKNEIRAKFDATINFFPVPTTHDFRIEVSDEDKAEMEQAIKDAEANVSKYLMKEMLAPIAYFVDKLAVPIGEKGSVFRDTLVGNLVELIDRLPRLNISNDPELTKVIQDVKAVVDTYNMDSLRDSPIIRQTARDKMAEIQSQMAAFMGN